MKHRTRTILGCLLLGGALCLLGGCGAARRQMAETEDSADSYADTLADGPLEEFEDPEETVIGEASAAESEALSEASSAAGGQTESFDPSGDPASSETMTESAEAEESPENTAEETREETTEAAGELTASETERLPESTAPETETKPSTRATAAPTTAARTTAAPTAAPRRYTNADFGWSTVTSPLDRDGDGIDDQTDILLGAKAFLATKPKYNSDYVRPAGMGCCCDVVADALTAAGYSLKELVKADILAWQAGKTPDLDQIAVYPAGTGDFNIDFRRTRNLLPFFKRNSQSLSTDPYDYACWQPGDIIIFSSKTTGMEPGHIGMISDRRLESGMSYVLHLRGGNQTEYEEHYMLNTKVTIVGHFRLNGFPRLLGPQEPETVPESSRETAAAESSAESAAEESSEEPTAAESSSETGTEESSTEPTAEESSEGPTAEESREEPASAASSSDASAAEESSTEPATAQSIAEQAAEENSAEPSGEANREDPI